MRLFDTHAHYYDERFDPDRDEVLSALPSKGVKRVVCPGCDLASSRQSMAVAEQYPFFYFAAGLHPENLEGAALSDLDEIEKLCAHPKCVAVGEIGLDYYWKENPPREFQREVFHIQLALAEELGLPVIVHDREAHRDCLEAVRAHPKVTGVYHCYSGSLEDAKALVKMGWMLSFTGVITYKNARKSLEVIQWLPMDRIMIETDSPYLAPEPFRGKRNDSGKVYRVVEAIAQVKGIEVEDAARITLENGKRFFGIGGNDDDYNL